MTDKGRKKNLFRRMYERQNSVMMGGIVFLGAIGLLIGICIVGGKSSVMKREEGQILLTAEEQPVTQEVLDYLGTMQQVKSAFPLLEFQGNLNLEGYRWNGNIFGIDFSARNFKMASQEGISNSNGLQLVFGSKAAKSFLDEKGKELKEDRLPLFYKQLLEGKLLLSAEQAGEESPELVQAQELEPEEKKKEINAQAVGILEETGQEEDQRVYMDIAKAGQICRGKGIDDAPHKLLVEVWHKKDSEKVINALGKIGFTGKNPFEEELEDAEEKEQNLRLYFCISALLLLFSGLYLKNLLWDGEREYSLG